MEKIIPGGYYTYDSATRKLWLSYEYYNLAVENIDIIKNLTSNKIMYSAKNPQYPISVENGCITHSYPSAGANTDKIQIVLRTPIVDSLTELEAVDGVVTLETTGKVLVLPTDNAALLPSFNEYVLNSNRLTIAESPFGGLKGSGSPDYAPGTLFCQTDGVYLTDTSGTNSTKTLTAGKLKELSLLTVDTTGHTITEEFIITNTATSNSPSVIDDCSSATGWSILNGSGEITVESGRIKVAGTSDSSGYLTIQKTVTLNLSAYTIFGCLLESNVAGSAYIQIKTGTPYKVWDSATRFILAQNTNSRFFLPLLAPQGTTGQNPSTVSGTFALASTSLIAVGVKIGNSAACTFYVDDITADTAKSAYIELQTPDNLADSSLTLQAWDGSAYQTTGTYKLDSTYSAVSTTTENWKLADGTKFEDCYGSGNGRALFPKGSSEETKTGSVGTITYSANKGTQKRIGIRVDLPPSDGGRTSFNKIRIKSILSYTDAVGNKVLDLSGNGNNGTIVGGVTKLNDGGLQFDGSTGYVDCGTKTAYNITGNLSIALRLKTPSSPVSRRIFAKTESNWLTGFQVSTVQTFGTIQFDIGKNVWYSTYNLASTSNLCDGNTHDIICVNTPTSLKLYVDGVLNKSVTVNEHQILLNNLSLMIGRNVYGNYYNSNVYTASLYSRELNDAEATAFHNNQSVDPTGLVLHYKPTPQNMGATTYEFSNDTNTSTGLQNVINPWIAILNPDSPLIDFYLFTHRPKNLSFKRNETGQIYEVTLYPGNGLLYHGQIYYSDVTRDTDSNEIPDCLEASLEGSLTKFLQSYGMVI